jgi:hypothetical protein
MYGNGRYEKEKSQATWQYILYQSSLEENNTW